MRFIALAPLILVLAACSEKTDPKPVPEPGPKPASKPEVNVPKALEAADKADGTADKIVGKCLMCNLGMDGKPELAAKHEGYTFHMCSAGCKTIFEKDPVKALGKVKLEDDE
jgi:hypothetical protein